VDLPEEDAETVPTEEDEVEEAEVEVKVDVAGEEVELCT
jgi:hypothetical protein